MNGDTLQMVETVFAGPLTPAAIRTKIMHVEEVIRALPDQRSSLPTLHHFANGLYVREVYMEAGLLLTGKIHKHEHINIISKGDVSVITEDGIDRITAPRTMVVRPGIKRILYVHEDTIWATIHFNPTNETDLGKLEKEFVTNSYDEFFIEGGV